MNDHATASLCDDPILIDLIRSLCGELASRPAFLARREDVARFMEDEDARRLFETAMERQRAAHSDRSGSEAANSNGEAGAMKEFEEARARLLENAVARRFLDAQQDFKNTEAILHLFITRTLQLGRVPQNDELLPESPCCNGDQCGCEGEGDAEGGECGRRECGCH